MNESLMIQYLVPKITYILTMAAVACGIILFGTIRGVIKILKHTSKRKTGGQSDGKHKLSV